MNKIPELQQKTLRKLRFSYSITAVCLLLVLFSAGGFYLRSTMPSRTLMMQLRRAKTVVQIEKILSKSPVRLSDDRMAEVYFNCAVNAFNMKNYDESCNILQKVLQSDAHPELKGSAHLEIANARFLSGRFQEGFSQLKLLQQSPEIPAVYKSKGIELEQYVRAEIKQ